MNKLLLPAIRGHIGDWVFYCCIMPLTELGNRVSYADEVHRNEHLSDMIQRELRKGRASEIAEYLATQNQRFFNSLVLAVYDRNPEWYPVSELQGLHRNIDLKDVGGRVESMGVLELSPSLQMFAIDGQHRLSGIKLLIEKNQASSEDQLPVVLVGHKKTKAGLERTRRLFTTLNKTAKKVSKGETIALDEDDTAAIVVRRLVEQHPYFTGKRIAYQATNNLPQTNQESLTTLGNLYDVTWAIFKKIHRPACGVPDKRVRPLEKTLKECENIVVEFFEALGHRFPAIRTFLTTKGYAKVVVANRHSRGGHILFRPVGLQIFTDLVAELGKSMEFDDTMDTVARLPVRLSRKPYAGILWDPGRSAMTLKGKTITRDLLRLAIDLPVKQTLLRKKLAGWLGVALTDVDLSDWVPKVKLALPKRRGR